MLMPRAMGEKMLKSHEKFHSSDGRRMILVADDEIINREILGAVLEEEYDVIFASDGQETMQQIRTHRDELSLVLLDLMMPVIPGIEVLKEAKADDELKHIPFIVMTADQTAEVECLNLGAIDYIPKPYPHKGIISARVQRAIELSEDRETLQHTERDPLTGLYNREFFYLYAERLIDDFHLAMQDGQFKVYYQPKFDVRPKAPVLSSAEALVRWQHPKLGLVNPGIFIPLFEDNGLIQELDNYVWREAGAQVRRWKDNFGFSVPVSVNVSRIDMYDPDLIGKFESILKDNSLTPDDLLLEITESAYTQDSEQIISTVNNLRELGFHIEMDDFGTGYSSLNMISELPIDALKLDMKFVRSAFSDQRDTRMLEVIIEIADRLGVPIIAEGVETEEQLLALRDLGCDIAQGFYFSKPVTEAVFGEFISARKNLTQADLEYEVLEGQEEEEPEEVVIAPKPQRKALRLKATNYIFAALAFVIALALMISDAMVNANSVRLEEANERYVQAEHAARNLEAGSDYLTENVRLFAVTGDLEYLNNYFEEANTTRRRDYALDDLEELLSDNDKGAYESLSRALDYSNELMEREYESMRLAQTAAGIPDGQVPDEVSGWQLTDAELSMTPAERSAASVSLVFDSVYAGYKEQIRGNVSQCTDQLIENSRKAVVSTRESMRRLLISQTVLVIILILVILAEVVIITLQVRAPLSRLVDRMHMQQPAEPDGAAELRFVSQTYNEILEENKKARRQLSYEATHDPLTGILNRSAYEVFMDHVDQEHIALLIIDVDEFKSINDTYGHDVGDLVLRKVAEILTQSFRSVDCVCRLGGDEFCVVMTRASSAMRQLVINKVARANDLLQHPKDGLPKVSLSVGVAFSDRRNPQGDIFKDADTALYSVKNGGRCGCAVFGDAEK